jgi:hypothetical protein
MCNLTTATSYTTGQQRIIDIDSKEQTGSGGFFFPTTVKILKIELLVYINSVLTVRYKDFLIGGV